MNYAFTVTKAGTEEMPIEEIEPIEYNRVWLCWSRLGINIIYKFKHEDSETSKRHVHFHGMLTTPKKLQYKDCMIEGYSIILDNMQKPKIVKGKKLTIQQHYDSVFNYCRHEDIENKRKIDLQLQEEREAKVYKKVIEAGQPLRQQKIKIKDKNALFKIELYTNI